jgi:hypothetical protein
VGEGFRVTAMGVWTNGGSNRSMAFKVYYGGILLGTVTTGNAGATTAQPWRLDVQVLCHTVAGGNMEFLADMLLNTTLGTTFSRHIDANVTPVAVSQTGTKAIGVVSVANNSGVSITVRSLVIEPIYPA